MILKEQVKEYTESIFGELQEIRHHLHCYPELSFQEKETASFLSSSLMKWGINHQQNVGGYGIVGLIKGKNPDKKVIALRADMDALAITETNHLSYKSLNTGVMHACGHDVHMTCLLGTIKLLQHFKDEFEGTVKFIFQPAEEELPGGAIKMIEAGVLKNPEPEVIMAQHVFPELEAGEVGFKSGSYMASSDEVSLIVRGKGGHAAIPMKRDETVLTAAQLVIDLEKELAAHKPEGIPSILAFGKFIADGTYNVIPSEVELKGTFRTFSENWRIKAHQIIREVADSVAEKYKTSCEVHIRKGYPALVNNENATAKARLAAVEFLGKKNVKELEPRMTVEDFARYAQLIPACFYRLGTSNFKKGIDSNLHTPTFDIDEKSIETGTGLMAWIALSNLKDQLT